MGKSLKVILATTILDYGPILRSLQKLNFETVFFEFREGLVYKNLWLRRLVRREQFRFLKLWTMRKSNEKLLKMARQFKPDILISTTAAKDITPETINQLKIMGIFTANWFTDLLNHWDIIEKLAPPYDIFGTSDSNVLKKLKEELGIEAIYLPEAVEMDESKNPFEKRQEIYPISFIGSYNPKIWQGRAEFLAAVKDLGLNIWGPEVWRESQVKDYYRGAVRGEPTFKIYEQSKIAVEVPWQDGVSAGVGLRPFEVMSRGACLFMYDVRPDMGLLFKEGTHYVGFKTQEEFRQKVEYYLNNNSARLAIARAGYEEVKRNHTFAARIEKILSLYNLSK